MRQHTRTRRAWITIKHCGYLGMLGIVLGLVVGVGCNPKQARAPMAPLAIRVVAAHNGPLAHRLSYVGTVHSQREIKVLARVGGTVVKLPIAEGGRAKKGSVIALLSAQDLMASYHRTGAELGKASTEWNHQCHWYRQYRKLGAAGSVSVLVVDRHRKACSAAGAAYRAAKASRALRGAIAAKTRERAPFTGRVLQWLSEPGENVMPGRPILLFGNDAREIRVQVVESDLRRSVRVGTPVQVVIGEMTHGLRVDAIAPMARGLGRTFEVKIRLPASTRSALRNGMSINVSFVIAQEARALTVPAAAVHGRGSESVIFLINGKRVRRIAVKLGVRDGRRVAIHGDLPKRFSVAVSNLDMLGDNTRVYPVPAGEGE